MVVDIVGSIQSKNKSSTTFKTDQKKPRRFLADEGSFNIKKLLNQKIDLEFYT